MDIKNDIESTGIEILGLFNTPAWTAKLLSITTERGNDFTLENFVSRKYGWANAEAELPALYVMGLREELIRDDGNSRLVWLKYAIEVYIAGDDTEQLEKKTNRYARIISETLVEKYRDNGQIVLVDYSPVFKYEDSLFKVCSVQFQIRAFQDLT